MKRRQFIAASGALLGTAYVPSVLTTFAQSEPWMKESSTKLEAELVTKYGASQRERIQRGLKQVSDFWRREDGPREAFDEFVRTNFAGDQSTLDDLFNRFQHNLEQFDGHIGEIGREFRQQSDLDTGPIQPFDDLFAGYDPSAHAIDDFFQNKLAFVVLLNFPLTDKRITKGTNRAHKRHKIYKSHFVPFVGFVCAFCDQSGRG
jgi:hypothetical protein